MAKGERRERPGSYAIQAGTYDRTRGASPTVVRALSAALGEPAGRRLLDVAGGTGNYGRVLGTRGFRVVVLDASLAMLVQAARKLGPGAVVSGDAEALPVRDRAVDAVMIVNAVHLMGDPVQAFREARRVMRGGPLTVTGFTRENLAGLFVYEYFGLDAPPTPRPAASEFVVQLHQAGFERVEHRPYVYTDTADGSLNALHTDAMRLAGPAYLRNTSFWHALDENRRRAGLEALAADLRSGVLQRRVEQGMREAVAHGHGALFAAWP